MFMNGVNFKGADLCLLFLPAGIGVDVLRDFLEEKYAQGDPAFLRCAAYFCPGQDDTPMEKLITDLCNRAQSHPR